MSRYFFIFLFIIIYAPHSFANFDDDKRFLAGVSINSKGHDFYIKYQEDPQYKNLPIHNGFNSNKPNIKISFNNNLYKKLQNRTASYSGYRNVEGFKNNKRKNDVKFAAAAISIGLFTVAAGAFTIGAIINAIDD